MIDDRRRTTAAEETAFSISGWVGGGGAGIMSAALFSTCRRRNISQIETVRERNYETTL